ncbi:MAG: transposase [bacterium]|nr:transposase [bacterium]
MDQVREIAWKWLIEYNEERPHDSLGRITPKMFREKIEAEYSSLELSAWQGNLREQYRND